MIFDEFKKLFQDAVVTEDKLIIQNNFHEAVRFLADCSTFDMLKQIIAIDKGNGETELIYHMFSEDGSEDLFLSHTVKDETESITDIFKSAQADENEIFDLFGIKFNGNNNLKRIYMPDNWKGFPLKKDYEESDERLVWNDSNNI